MHKKSTIFCNILNNKYTNNVKGGKVMQDMSEIYSQYSKIVYKYIFCLTKNEETAEEITQDTFLVAVKNIDKFKGECKISTWLCQIAKYLWYKELRKVKKIKIEELEKFKESDLLIETVEESVIQKEEKLELLKRLQKLDDKTRNVMYLRLFVNLNYEEIGLVLNKSANWARVTFFRGKEKLKEEKL